MTPPLFRSLNSRIQEKGVIVGVNPKEGIQKINKKNGKNN